MPPTTEMMRIMEGKEPKEMSEEGKKIVEAFEKELKKPNVVDELIDKVKKVYGREHIFMISYMTSKGYGMAVGNLTPEEVAVKMKKEDEETIVVLWSRRISMKRALEIGLVDGEEIVRNLFRETKGSE